MDNYLPLILAGLVGIAVLGGGVSVNNKNKKKNLRKKKNEN